MSEYVKIEDHEDLVKDKTSGAVLNINNDALKAYKMARKKNVDMQNRMNKMEDDISEIKSLLKELINKG